MLDYSWTCSCCGKQQRGLPLDYGTDFPDHYLSVPESERATRTELSRNFCVVDDQAYMRGIVQIPIVGRSEVFAWGAWLSLSEASYTRVRDIWDRRDTENAGPFVGWFSVTLPLYPATLGLKARAHLRQVGLTPLLELEPTDHPLAVEQRTGITLARAVEIAESLLPRH